MNCVCVVLLTVALLIEELGCEVLVVVVVG